MKRYYLYGEDSQPLDKVDGLENKEGNWLDYDEVANLTKGIEWTRECDNPPCDKGKIWRPQSLGPTLFDDCSRCNGTGTITRPATLGEVLEKAKRWLVTVEDNILECEEEGETEYKNILIEKALTINGGTLRIKQ